ncbi:MAG: MauE/DoxX family redox-associated membrane protein [Desulfuromonadales bacterium]
MRSKRILYHGCRLFLGGLFLYAGILKANDVAAFAGNIAGYRILPYAWNYLLAAILPYVEVLAGGLLLTNNRVRASAFLLGALTLLFMAVLMSAIYRGLEIDCGCFHPADRTTPLAALGRDAGILLLAILTYRLRGKTSP